MKNLKAINSLDEYEEYELQTISYGRVDAIFALTLYIVMIIMFSIMGQLFLQRGSSLTETYVFWTTGIVALLLIVLVFILCYIRKQKFVSVGFSKSNIFMSFRMGLSISAIVISIKGLLPIMLGSAVQTDIGLIIMKVVYYFVFIAFMEELVMRGYIGTRLYGYIRNKRLSIVIVGIMFSLLHIPLQIMITQMSLIEYISLNFGNLIYFIIFHFVFQWLYSKYNSIVAPTILHFIWDFIHWFIII